MTATQLTLDGREVPHREVIAAQRFGEMQQSVLRRLASQPGMTTSELEHQLGPGGGQAVRRLHRRGVVVKHVGLWFIVKGPFE